MKINKSHKINIRVLIGMSLFTTFILTLIFSIKWANYQKIFKLNEPIITGYDILDEQDYRKIISQLDYDIIYSTDVVHAHNANL